MPKPSAPEARKNAIIVAARTCFLKFGYAKTSLDDIAKVAGISRPLIYRAFDNKERIFAAVFEDTFTALYPRAKEAARGPGSKADRLRALFEILLVEPWEQLAGAPMAAEFYAACAQMVPDAQAKYERVRLQLTVAILGDRELALVLHHAVDGLCEAGPKASQLRRWLAVLIERFTV